MIDSLNLSAEHLEAIFIHHEHYLIETVKSKAAFEPKVWSRTFGRALKQNIIEAKIIHTNLGLTLPLKTIARTPSRQTVEFAGLHGYNDRSELVAHTLDDLKSQLQHTWINRIDIAIDFEKIPTRIIRQLCKTRVPKRFKNSTYYKTPNEKKTNSKMNILTYDKALKEKLDYELHRLEFSFKAPYFKGLCLKDLDLVITKMEKSIKRATGLSVKIERI